MNLIAIPLTNTDLLLNQVNYDNGATTFELHGDTKKRVCIDTTDVKKVVDHSTAWYLSSNGYVFLTAWNRPTQYLHKLILSTDFDGFVVDHINGNKLDNRKQNLQLITPRQNIAKAKNGSVYGTNIILDRNFRVRVIHKGKSVHIGRYDSLEEAKTARNNWYIKNNIQQPTD